MPLFRRSRRCFYCNRSSLNEPRDTARSWLCPHCSAVNYLDQYGRITEPPNDVTATPRAYRPQMSQRTSPPPAALRSSTTASPENDVFCRDCQRNQLIVNNIMANYLPDDDDPGYARAEAAIDAYRTELETKYPIVCENCLPSVHQMLREKNYAAQTDHLRRVLDYGRRMKRGYSTRQVWLLRLISFAKWSYIFSIIVGVIWHTFGLLASPHLLSPEYAPVWSLCFSQIAQHGRIGFDCLQHHELFYLIQIAILADFCTLLWNPKLEQKTLRPGGRMFGLLWLWAARLFVSVIRYYSFGWLQSMTAPTLVEDAYGNTVEKSPDLLMFRLGHSVLLALILVAAKLSWSAIELRYQATPFMQRIDPHLPQVRPRSSDRPHTPARPDHTAFDTMAQSFTSSFNETPGSAIDWPASPTETERSYNYDSDGYTPRPTRTTTERDPNAMDWSPTRHRWGGRDPITIPPNPFDRSTSRPAQPPPPATRGPHSIFTQRDPNPFRHRVPPAPKAPAQRRADPWKPGLWAPPSDERKQTFFNEFMRQNDSPGARDRLAQAVPKRVRDEAELFRPPQLIYDYDGYTGIKTTGLEESFNSLFQK